MASKEGQENCETEEETMALQKKRSRRVSFAETTAIHLFSREEEEYETPPDATNANASLDEEALRRSESEEMMELLQSSDESGDEDDGVALKGSFIRPSGSPSPASTFGSATSNDEVNFFGPVSTDFIKPRRLSDSAASDENHDITMDSTAFSMHFRSLAKSDSAGEFKTPTGVHLAFDERTSGPISTATSTGDLMMSTGTRKPIARSSLPADKVNSGHSDDMSLVGENRHRYDYGKLPRELDVLLAEGGKDLSSLPLPSDVTPKKDLVKAPLLQANSLLFDKDEKLGEGATEASAKFLSPLSMTLLNVDNDQPSKPSFANSVSSLLAKRRQVFKVSSLNFTKGVSRFNRPEDFPFSSTSKAENNASRLMSSEYFTRSKAKDKLLGYRKDISEKYVDAPVVCLEAQFSNVVDNGREIKSLNKMDANGLRSREETEFSSSFEAVKEVELQSSSKPMPQHHYPSTTLCSQVALVDKVSEPSSLCSLSIDGQTKTLARFANVLSVKSMESIAGSTSSLDRNNKLPIQALETPTGELSCSLLSGKPSDSADDARDVTTPVSNRNTGKDDKNDELLEKPCYVCGINSSSGLKRKYEGLSDKDDDKGDKMASLQHKLKLFNDQSHCAEGNKVSYMVGVEKASRHWDDVFSSFCGAIQSSLFPRMDKLDLAQIEILHDLLFHVEKKKKYELFQHDICFQKALDNTCFLQKKRMMDAKLLLYKTAFEKAKLQLMLLKRDKLSDLLEQLNSRVQESEKLMSSCRLNGQNGINADCFRSESHCTDVEEECLVPDDISSLRKELEVSDIKIKHSMKSLHSHFDVVESQACTQTSEFGKDFLKKRASCRSLQSELQLCEVESLKAENGQQNIIFDHLGFLSQRFMVSSNYTSGVAISNKFNNVKISKPMFLSMDAYTGFSFVFRGDTFLTQYAGLRTIAQETQKTNSFLLNLLHVVEEVALAMTELRNLTQSKFCQPSAGKLDLQFSFFDFKSGARVSMNIDVSCLKWGVYPSQVLPYEVQGSAPGDQESFQLLLNNIRTVVGGLSCRYMRVISLCRCVSKTIEDGGLS